MTNLSAPMPATEPAEAILHVFQTTPHPLTVAQAEKLYNGPKLKKGELRQLIETQLLMQGQLFKCSPSGKSSRYWSHDEEEKVRETVVDLLANAPLAESKLATAVNKALPKISSPAAIKNYLHNMRHEGLLHQWPGKGKTMLLSLRPYDPLSAITLTAATRKSLSAVLAKIETLGGSMEDLLQVIRRQLRPSTPQAPPPVMPQAQLPELAQAKQEEEASARENEPSWPAREIDELILKGMRDLNAAVDQGATVLLRDLRRHMPPEYRSHEAFDAAVIRLAEQEKIVLHRHDQPSFLTDAERDELVRDANGTYFTAIAQRV